MDFEKLFNPSSIAVVGVSHDLKKVGYLVANNLINQGYKCRIYFVNKNASEDILGKKVYPSLSEVGEKIDLAVLATPAAVSLSLIDEIGQLGIKDIVIFAAGFKEIGKDGVEIESELIEKIKKYNINLLGPNCIGFINTLLNINVTFLKHISPSGNIGFISQSGALGSVIIDYFAGHKNLGFSYFISLGNKTNIDESDALEFLLKDSNTKVIGMYLEDVKNGKRFMDVLNKAAKIKPIVILKAGSTTEGSKAAISHTGGLVGDDQVYDAVFNQNGAIRAFTFTEFMTILKIYSYDRVPTNRALLVLSNAGGVGVLFTDDIVKNKLSLVTISPETEKELTSTVGENKKISIRNPIDLLGDASAFEYSQAIGLTMQEKDIGSIGVLLTPQANTQIFETAEVIAENQSHLDKPIFPIFMGEESVAQSHVFFEEKKMVSFSTYDFLSQCLAKILQRQEFHGEQNDENGLRSNSLPIKLQEQEIKNILNNNFSKPFLNLGDSMSFFKLLNIPVLDLLFLDSESKIQDLKSKIKYPAVVKIASDIITHKTEVNGVITGIKSEIELKEVFNKITASGKAKGIYIQQMVKGHEIFLGAKRDNNFGVVIVVGLGGIYAELLKEINYLVFPFSQKRFTQMIEETKLAKLFKGFRGSKSVDIRKLYDISAKIGYLMENFKEIKEIDINPLFLNEEKLVVADARIIL
ncbi:MAG: acetate--CoA ligase family protein [Candidatus Roizmanbacteria bacterium]|nr:MAG: acetate--CoA ligase family protein [Candidatus Roizmanbacteria bacterium]